MHRAWSLWRAHASARVLHASQRFGGSLVAFGERTAERIWRIGVILPGTSYDAEYQVRQATFVQALKQLGRSRGRNVLIDTRWAAGDANLIRKYAIELMALAPVVILSGGLWAHCYKRPTSADGIHERPRSRGRRLQPR